MWTKEQTKLELAGDLIEEVMPLLKDRQVLLLFDSWYAKSSLIERFLQYPHLAIICNVRSDSAMYELPPLPNGKPGRPKQHEIFLGTLFSKAQTAKNPTGLVQALCKLASSTSEAA